MFQQSKVEKLFDKAKDKTAYHGMQKVDVFYRNKPKSYYDQILSTSGVMETRLKDMNGDNDCPINGRIKGTFFSANNPRGVTCRMSDLPSRSPFGGRRLIIPTSYFGSSLHLYFADFYCTSRRGPHYVTVVMVKPHSSTDNFCAQKLVKLDIYDNPFLKQVGSEWRATTAVWVELFYTDNVDLDNAIAFHGAKLEDVPSTGVATPFGIPKNTRCSVCNIGVYVNDDFDLSDDDSDDDYGAYGGGYSPKWRYNYDDDDDDFGAYGGGYSPDWVYDFDD